MKKKKKFNPYSKPSPPLKPKATVQVNVVLSSFSMYPYTSMEIPKCPEGATHIYVANVDYDSYDVGAIDIQFIKLQKVPVEDYEKKIKKYNEKYELYKEELKEWNTLKKAYDDETKDVQLKSKRAMYEKLKKELGE